MAGCAVPVRARRSALDGVVWAVERIDEVDVLCRQNLCAPIQFAAEHWHALVEPARHPDVLRSLPREHEGDQWWRGGRLPLVHAGRERPGQQSLRVRMIPADEGELYEGSGVARAAA